MKYTLLDLVQSVLNSIGGDEVNSYADTVESRSVATMVRDVYSDIISQIDLPEHYTLFELSSSGETSKPTIMYIPANCTHLDWVKYNNAITTDTSAKFRDVQQLSLDNFLDMMYQLSVDTDGVETFSHVIEGNTIDLFCYNNKSPQYYTTFDDNTLLFDSYLNTEDTTLQKNKSLAYGILSPTFTMADTFVPDLDERQFPLLLNEVKAQAFAELKQTENVLAERKARRHWVVSQVNKTTVPVQSDFDRLPNYGRKR